MLRLAPIGDALGAQIAKLAVGDDQYDGIIGGRPMRQAWAKGS